MEKEFAQDISLIVEKLKCEKLDFDGTIIGFFTLHLYTNKLNSFFGKNGTWKNFDWEDVLHDVVYTQYETLVVCCSEQNKYQTFCPNRLCIIISYKIQVLDI